MVTKAVKIQNATGMHARPASLLVKEVKKFSAKVRLQKNGKDFDPGSILSILSMGAKFGEEITIWAEGTDAQAATDSIAALFDSNFGE